MVYACGKYVPKVALSEIWRALCVIPNSKDMKEEKNIGVIVIDDVLSVDNSVWCRNERTYRFINKHGSVNHWLCQISHVYIEYIRINNLKTF